MNLKIRVGNLVPHFSGRTTSNPAFAFHTTAGRNILPTFVASAKHPLEQRLLNGLAEAPNLLDDRESVLFVVTPDGEDEVLGRVPARVPGIRAFYDTDYEISDLFGVEYKINAPVSYLISPRLQVTGIVLSGGPEKQLDTIIGALKNCIPIERLDEVFGSAPILIVPYVFDPAFCLDLVARYQHQGGTVSGFMREVDGRTIAVHDHSHKIRRDTTLIDAAVIETISAQFKNRVMPQIARAYQYHGQYMERFTIACYDSEEGGHFAPHRDNMTSGTAHRRFAATVTLNDDYDGGELRFPEFGARTYHPPRGSALVFSCSLLHQVLPVRRGKRYAFLPFIYDEAGARVRSENQHLMAPQPDAAEDRKADRA
jgi:predicted 2-oxoglutarate/Fe(II)-dependent dioxygenase YbiX